MAKKGKTWRPPTQSRSGQARSTRSRPAQTGMGQTGTGQTRTSDPPVDQSPVEEAPVEESRVAKARTAKVEDQASVPTANRQARKEEARRQREGLRRKAARRRMLNRIVAVAAGAIVVAGVVLAFVVFGLGSKKIPQSLHGIQTDTEPWPAESADLQSRLRQIGIGFLGKEALAFHIHQHLDLFVNGQRVTVPAQIGFLSGSTGLAFLHTHDTTGVIHVESPVVKNYTLGNFFDVWGVLFTKDQLGAYKATGDDKVRVFVNGKPFTGDPRSIVLRNFEEIVVAFGTPAQLPKPLPRTYGPFQQAKKAEQKARKQASATPTPSASGSTAASPTASASG